MLCALSAMAAAATIPLEWNQRFASPAPYEVVIDRSKLDQLAGIATDTALDIYAVSAQGETKLDTKVFDHNRKSVEALRFTVPAGTVKLYAKTSDSKTVKSCVNATDNVFAGALKTPEKWRSSKKVSISGTKNGILLKAKTHDRHFVKYRVNLPQGFAGEHAKLDLELKSVSPLTWGSGVKIEQYDSKGKILNESLTDPRWISQMRPPQTKTHYCETGFFHKDAKSIALVIEMCAVKYSYDNYGLEITDHTVSLPQLEISKLSLRKANELPFPAYDRHFFAEGISGAAGDTALNLDGRTMFFYTPVSHAVYGESKQMRAEEHTFWPLNDATVEMWFKPTWKKDENRELVLLTATNRDREDRRSYKKNFGEMFAVRYKIATSTWAVRVQDGKLKTRTFSFKHAMESGKWSHIAFQYGKDGFSACIDGKKVFEDTNYSFTNRGNVFKDKKPNGLLVQQIEIGGLRGSSRGNFDTTKAAPFASWNIDLLRVSRGKRFTADFTPAKNYTVDKDTAALFNFDHSINGKSGWGQGNILGSINHKYLPLSTRRLTVDNKRIQYYPAKLQDHSNPDKVLNIFNYQKLPAPADFKAARKNGSVKFTATPGMTKELTAPENVYMDYVEISCPADVKLLSHPALIANDELDTRSFGDIADSLKLDKVSEKDRANILFNLVIRASDYFMTNQVCFPAHSNAVKRGDYLALMLLNDYCGFECGPLNNMAANMFTCAGMMPAVQTGGYGHSFQQVYYDGKNHVYDLSAQRFFPAHDNETAASLRQLDIENGPFQRYANSGGAFIRQGVSRGYTRHIPTMQKRIAYNLHPGEKMRLYFYNAGAYNDLQTKRCIDPNAVHPNDPFPYPLEFRIAKEAPKEVIASEKVYQLHRPFPHYSNAYLTFSGKPSKDNGAFCKVTDSDFCYLVDVPYPVISGIYKATVDGKPVGIELSTDGGKSFRKLVTDDNGKATYAVRARQAYYIKVKAPISKVDSFSATTEMMFNSRVQNGKLKAGKNTLLFKARRGEKADVTIAYRYDAKDIVIDDAPYAGTIPGHERQLGVVEPGKSVSFTVTGADKSAVVSSTCGVTAKLENGKLTVTAKADGKAPRFDNVIINDNGAKKELTILVADKVRIATIKDAKLLNGGKIAAPGSDSPQSCAVVKNTGDRLQFNFAEIPAGEYMVWTLTRIKTGIQRSPLLGTVTGKGIIEAMRGINAGNEFYKAMYGTTPDKTKGRFKWDIRIDKDQNKYPYYSPRATTLEKCSSITLAPMRNTEIEVAAVMVLPMVDNVFRSEMVKTLCGLNYEPWKLEAHSK